MTATLSTASPVTHCDVCVCVCQCSGVCGEGRMVRAVTCRSSGGVVMSEDQCDQLLRPLAIYPCGDRDCAPHWVEQEWQQV